MPPRKVAKTRKSDPARDAYNVELGKRLEIARKGARLEPEDVAKALKMPLNTYQKHERGDRQFPMHRVLEFCRLTGFSPTFIVTGHLDADWQVGPETGKFKRPKVPVPS